MFPTCIQEMPTSNLGQFTCYPQVFRCSPLPTIQAIFGQRLAVDLNLFFPKNFTIHYLLSRENLHEYF